jgi:hypothetical protein
MKHDIDPALLAMVQADLSELTTKNDDVLEEQSQILRGLNANAPVTLIELKNSKGYGVVNIIHGHAFGTEVTYSLQDRLIRIPMHRYMRISNASSVDTCIQMIEGGFSPSRTGRDLFTLPISKPPQELVSFYPDQIPTALALFAGEPQALDTLMHLTRMYKFNDSYVQKFIEHIKP